MTATDDVPTYSPAYAIPAEGYRIGLVTCLLCGAAIPLIQDADAPAIHTTWHLRLNRTLP